MQAGLLDTYRNPIQSRKWPAWVLSAVLVVSYLVLYFTDVLEAPARALRLGSKWTLYGLVYSLAMVVGGAFFLRRHGNSRYQRIRTISVVFFQVVFAFALPLVMTVLGRQEYYFSYFWPLKIEYLYPDYILQQPFLIVLYSFFGSLIVFPIAGYYLGKRFYCSWICGCGGLANTAGEPFRHLSSKSAAAWRFEKYSVYAVLGLAIAATIVVGLNWALGRHHPGFATFAFRVQASTSSGWERSSPACSGSACIRSWARACGAASPARWPPCSASSRSSDASGSRSRRTCASRAATARRTARWVSTSGSTPWPTSRSSARLASDAGCARTCARGAC